MVITVETMFNHVVYIQWSMKMACSHGDDN